MCYADKDPPEEIAKMQEWLKCTRGPPQKVFEKLNRTYFTRRDFIKTAKNFNEVVTSWPRLFDVEGAVGYFQSILSVIFLTNF